MPRRLESDDEASAESKHVKFADKIHEHRVECDSCHAGYKDCFYDKSKPNSSCLRCKVDKKTCLIVVKAKDGSKCESRRLSLGGRPMGPSRAGLLTSRLGFQSRTLLGMGGKQGTRTSSVGGRSGSRTSTRTSSPARTLRTSGGLSPRRSLRMGSRRMEVSPVRHLSIRGFVEELTFFVSFPFPEKPKKPPKAVLDALKESGIRKKASTPKPKKEKKKKESSPSSEDAEREFLFALFRDGGRFRAS